MLVHHIRSGNRFIGTVVALDKDVVGWSQCCDKERTRKEYWDKSRDPEKDWGFNEIHIPADTFSKEMGIRIAEGRALSGGLTRPTHDWRGVMIRDALEKIRLRSQHYFKVSPYEYEQSLMPF